MSQSFEQPPHLSLSAAWAGRDTKGIQLQEVTAGGNPSPERGDQRWGPKLPGMNEPFPLCIPGLVGWVKTDPIYRDKHSWAYQHSGKGPGPCPGNYPGREQPMEMGERKSPWKWEREKAHGNGRGKQPMEMGEGSSSWNWEQSGGGRGGAEPG